MNSDTRKVSVVDVTPVSTSTMTHLGTWKLCFLNPSIAYGITRDIDIAQRMFELTVNMQNVLIPM